jgi:hypothetical protein
MPPALAARVELEEFDESVEKSSRSGCMGKPLTIGLIII